MYVHIHLIWFFQIVFIYVYTKVDSHAQVTEGNRRLFTLWKTFAELMLLSSGTMSSMSWPWFVGNMFSFWHSLIRPHLMPGAWQFALILAVVYYTLCYFCRTV